MGLEILYLLIPATFVLAATALTLFVWAIHAGQFDDLETPAIRVLFDDEPGPRGAQGFGSAPVIEPAHPPVKRLA